MNFELSKEQELVQKTARDFAEKELKPIAIENDEKSEFPID
ncbi:acyl-CoA dehydrogenase family protein, partial [Clostridium tyrobutyricum]